VALPGAELVQLSTRMRWMGGHFIQPISPDVLETLHWNLERGGAVL
jgi:hypothetical protein